MNYKNYEDKWLLKTYSKPGCHLITTEIEGAIISSQTLRDLKQKDAVLHADVAQKGSEDQAFNSVY